MTGDFELTQPLSNQLLGELIKKIRKTNNLTQASFGKLLEPSVTQSTIARWEKGEQKPDEVHFPKLASLLNLSVEELSELIKKPSADIQGLNVENKTLTHNKRHLALLKKGAKAWNKWREKNHDVIPQLSGISLTDMNLEGYDLDNANLAGCYGTLTSLYRASLIEANFEKAEFKESSFREANLTKANLKNLVASDTSFNRAIFREANLSKASIQHSDFVEANLENAYLQSIDLNKINFSRAILSKVHLSNSKLFSINFREANLNEASLEKAIISNCFVYGVSFLGTNFAGIKQSNIYVSASGSEGIPINDISLAPIICLQRHNSTLIKKFFRIYQMEEEAVNLANVLIDKYSEYSHTYGFQIYNNIEEKDEEIPYYEIRKNNNDLFVRVIPNYKKRRFLTSEEAESRIILTITGGLLESNLNSKDIEILKKMVQFEEKNQQERVDLAAPMIVKMLDFMESDKLVSPKYTLIRTEQEIILQSNSEAQIELMRVKPVEDEWQIVNSSLSKNNCKDIQIAVEELKNSSTEIT